MNAIKTDDTSGYITFLRRTPRKLPKVEPPISTTRQSRTGWLRWPFHRLEPLREELMKKTFVQRLNPVLNGAGDARKRHKAHRHDKSTHDDGRMADSRHVERHRSDVAMVVGSNHASGRDKAHKHEKVPHDDGRMADSRHIERHNRDVCMVVGSNHASGRDKTQKHEKVPHDHDDGGRTTDCRHVERHRTDMAMVVGSNHANHVLKSGSDKNHEHKEVKRRPRSTNTKCNDSDDNSTQRTKRMSYPPCDMKGLLEYLQRLNTKDVVPTMNPPYKGTVPPRLSNAFSTSCPALYNPKYADKVQSHKLFGSRRQDGAHASKGAKHPNDQIKVRNHHKGTAEGNFVDQHSAKSHRNHVRAKVKKSKNHSTHDSLPRRPKPPSWQDPTPPPTLTVTEPPEKESPTVIIGEHDPPPSSKAESVIAASSVFDTDGRSINRRSGLSRSHLKRTRSRVIDSREIPEEDHVIPLSRTQQHEFHLKETHQDNRIYLTENAQRCRKWLSELEVEDLRDDDGAYGLTAFPERYKETVTLDLEVSHDRWNYLGSPYPSDSDSDAD